MCQVSAVQKNISVWNWKSMTVGIADAHESRPVGAWDVGHIVWIVLCMDNSILTP